MISRFFAGHLGRRLILFVMLATLPAMLAALVVFTAVMGAHFQRLATEKLAATAANLAERVDRWADDVARDLVYFCREPDVVSMDPGCLRAELQEMLRSHPTITDAHVIGPDGMNVARGDDLPLIDYHDHKYFQRVMAGAPMAWETLLKSRSSGHPALNHAAPIRGTDGAVVGVVVFEVDLRQLCDVVGAARHGHTGYSFVVDDQGRALAHPKFRDDAELRDLSGMPPVREVLRNRTSHASLFQDNQGTWWFAHALPAVNGWSVVSVQEKSEVLADAQHALVVGLLIVALAGSATAWLTWFAARCITRPIRQMTAIAHQIVAGDRKARMPSGRADELGILAQAFNRTLDESARHMARQVRINRLWQDELVRSESLAEKLKMITDTLVEVFVADSCRIWAIAPGDRCESGCIHAKVTEGPHVCRQRDRCLHLLASSGRYTHLDGDGHRRVPFGCYKIGRVAAGEDLKFLTNDVQHDPQAHNHEWAAELGLVSFAGYRLCACDGTRVGVLALFAKRPLTLEEDQMLEGIAASTSKVMQTARAKEELERAYRDLENRIQQRTAELELSNERLRAEIDERAAVEAALRRSEERYRTIAETAQDAIITADAEGKIHLWNPAAEKIFGFSAAEIVGQNMLDYIVPARYRDAKRKGFAEFVRTGQGPVIGKTLELTALRRDGSEFPIEISVSACRDRNNDVAIAVVRDITERKQVEESLRESEKRFMDVLYSSADAILLIGDNTFIDCNEATARMLGYATREEFLQTHPSALSPPRQPDGRDSFEKAEEMMRLAFDTGFHRFEWIHRRANGADFPVEVSLTPIVHKGRSLLHCVWRDITERRALEQQLAQAQKLESIGQLAAGIAHEINTPTQFVSDNTRFLRDAFPKLQELLARYQQLSDACRSGAVTDALLAELEAAVKKAKLDYLLKQIPEALSDSLEGLERVTKIVRAMKDFAHPGQRSMSPTDLNKAIESTVTVARNEWKYVADVTLDLDPTLPPVPCLVADFNQAILNMIVNAAHAIKDVIGDGGHGKGTITISTRLNADQAEVRISDTGTGIPVEHRDRIFDPFFTTKEVGKGTGQGLAIARRIIVEKHHGTLTFETEVGQGTTFVIRLPVEPDDRKPQEELDHELAHSARR